MKKNLPKRIPFYDFGGQGSLIHFAHANGFPPACYLQLIKPFIENYKVIGMEQRPIWEGSNPLKLKSWTQLADDLIVFFDQNKLKNIVGIGHSMGCVVSVLAAQKRPDLFSKLILIEPVIVPKKFNFFFKLLPISLRKRFYPIARISSKRKDLWDSQQEVYDSYRTKRVFKRFSDTSLKNLVLASTKKAPSGKFTLTFPKAWETQIYATAPSIFDLLKKIEIPIIAVKGETTNVISSQIWEEWQRATPQNKFIEFPDAGHLVPMEYPKELANSLLKMIL